MARVLAQLIALGDVDGEIPARARRPSSGPDDRSSTRMRGPLPGEAER